MFRWFFRVGFLGSFLLLAFYGQLWEGENGGRKYDDGWVDSGGVGSGNGVYMESWKTLVVDGWMAKWEAEVESNMWGERNAGL